MSGEAKANLIASLRGSIAEVERGSHVENPFFQSVPSQDEKQNAVKDNKKPKEEKDFDNPNQAYKKILRLLGYRERTAGELREKLLSDGFSIDATETSLERAIRLGLVNDQRYLESFINTAFHSGKGKRTVEQTLKQKGFAPEDIAFALDDSPFSEEDEPERAYAYLLKHHPRGKNLRDSAFRKLIAKGYTVGSASKAASKYCENMTKTIDFENN